MKMHSTKPHARPPAGFFPAEAAGLRWLGEATAAGGVAVPEVLAVDEECLILRWVEPGKASADAASAFGQALAATHAAGAPAYGGEADGFISKLPLPNSPCDSWPEFYAVRRVLPYLKLARDRGAVTDAEAATVEGVIGKLTALLPEEPPARLHGDLWNGNVLWGQESRVWLVDPAAYGGHRELDLAMLALFGLPHLPRVLEAYQERSPLADGWEERLPLHQLFPLLVHAALFGGGYGSRAAEAAARYA
jgi:fructosamine-3-kinase